MAVSIQCIRIPWEESRDIAAQVPAVMKTRCRFGYYFFVRLVKVSLEEMALIWFPLAHSMG